MLIDDIIGDMDRMINGIVYIARNTINDKSYIGLSTNSLKIRMEGHKRNAKNIQSDSNSYFHKAIRKYGFESFSWNIIDRTNNIKELRDLEKIYIDMFDTFNNGYNLTLGGDGLLGYIPTKKTREKLSKAGKLRTYTVETRKRISQGKMGHEVSLETRKKITESKKGCKLSEEHKKKIGNSVRGVKNGFYGKHHTEETLSKFWKTVLQFKKNGEFVKKYKSIEEATAFTKIEKSNISAVCREKRKYAGNFIWKFEEKLNATV